MAIATGTAALIAAGVTAGGAVAATKIQANAANKAQRLQKQATDDALAYQKEQDQYIRSRYEKEDAREEEARRLYQQYLASQGKGPAPAAAAPAPENMHPVAVAARQAVMQPGYSARPAQPTLRELGPGFQPAGLLQAAPESAAAVAPAASAASDVSTMPTLADTARWTEWDPYLGARA